MKALHIVAATLVIVGAVNWGLVAIAQFDLVAALFGMRFGEVNPITALVYGLVGLAGLYQAITLFTAPRHTTPSYAGNTR